MQPTVNMLRHARSTTMIDPTSIALANIKNKSRLKGKKAAVVICMFAEYFKPTANLELEEVKCDDCNRPIIKENYNDPKLIRKTAKYICPFCATKGEIFNNKDKEFKKMVLEVCNKYLIHKDVEHGGILFMDLMKKLSGGG